VCKRCFLGPLRGLASNEHMTFTQRAHLLLNSNVNKVAHVYMAWAMIVFSPGLSYPKKSQEGPGYIPAKARQTTLPIITNAIQPYNVVCKHNPRNLLHTFCVLLSHSTVACLSLHSKTECLLVFSAAVQPQMHTLRHLARRADTTHQHQAPDLQHAAPSLLPAVP
jgi:hypothetical protein